MKKLRVLVAILSLPIAAFGGPDRSVISTRAVFVDVLRRNLSLLDFDDIAAINSTLESEAGPREIDGWLVFFVPRPSDGRIVFMPLNQGYDLNAVFREKLVARVNALLDERLAKHRNGPAFETIQLPEPTAAGGRGSS